MPSPYRPNSPRPNNNGGQNRGNFRKEDKGPKRNDRIRATEVRVISPKGEMMGIMPTQQALDLAREFGVDLIEIAASAVPPVCKLQEYGKYLYEEAKKHKHQKSATKVEHPEIGIATITKAIEALMHISTRDNEPKRSGRAIVVGLTPVQQNKRKLVHNEAPGEEDGEDDSAVDNDEGDAE